MSRTTWIIVGVLGAGAVALIAYFLLQRSPTVTALPVSGSTDSSGSAAGIVARIGGAVTDLTSTIVGAAQSDGEVSGEDAAP